MLTIIATFDDEGLRADAFLAKHADLSRSAVVRLIESGRILRNGLPVIKRDTVCAGERYTLDLPAPRPDGALPQELPLDVVYEDDDIIVVNKTRGMVTHPSAGHDDGTLVNALLAHCKGQLSGIGGVERPGIVHRLDRDTSGLLVAAKNDFAHAALSEALQAREVSRCYEALLIGTPEPPSGKVDAPLGRDPRNRLRMAVRPDGRKAVTHYTLLGKYHGISHVECRLETGRTHQIRVHMAYIGHPALGDTLYGAGRNPFGWEGQCLHARRLGFVHPRTGEAMEFVTELPKYFEELLAQLEG